jgi:hypothetical protein
MKYDTLQDRYNYSEGLTYSRLVIYIYIIRRMDMKRLVCFVIIASAIISGLYAFDSSVSGSWGLIDPDGEKVEFLRFSNAEIIIMETLYRKGSYTESTDSIYFNGEDVVMQYYRLSPNKLLFILFNTDDMQDTITLILSKL